MMQTPQEAVGRRRQPADRQQRLPSLSPGQSMSFSEAHAWYAWLPLWNTIILLSSSVTVHFAHTGLLDGDRCKKFNTWLAVTVALGVHLHRPADRRILRGLRALRPDPGFRHLRLDLLHAHGLSRLPRADGIDDAGDPAVPFPAQRGTSRRTDHFGFEASSWYWHFVDVVWVFLFLFVYIL
jgi:cytochrome c oxidase subunit 3